MHSMKELDQPATPELEKLASVKDVSQQQGQFLEWLLGEKDLVIAQWDEEDWLHPIHVRIEVLLAEYHGIDLAKVEEEKSALLAWQRRKVGA